MKRLILPLTLLALAPLAPAQPVELDEHRKPSFQTGGNVLIRGGTLLTVTRGTMPDTDLLVRDGRIAQIGRNLTAPAGFAVVDARGKIVSPGIIDAHLHIAQDSVNEGADAITPEASVTYVLNPEDRRLWLKLSTGNTSSLVLHGSANPIGGESAIIKHKYKGEIEDLLFPGAPRVVKFALGENVTRAGSATNTRFPNTRMGVEAVYRRAFHEARNYMAEHDRWARNPQGPRPRRDLRLEALADMLRGNIVIHCHAYRADEMLMLLRLKEEFNLRLIAFQHALDGYRIAPEMRAAGVGASLFIDNWAYKVEAYDAIGFAASLLNEKGVLTSINTDTTGGATWVNLDAAKAMRFGGTSPGDALKMVTINPAKQLLIDRYVGSLEVGKHADIAIWDGHPLSVYSRCAMTFIDGELVFERRDPLGVYASARISNEVRTPAPYDRRPLPPASRAYAIVGATVHPVSGPAIANGTVVVRDGRIAEVGRMRAPAGVTVIDGRGLHVYPGFIDAGSDVGRAEIGSIRATLDTTELGQFQPDLVALTALNPESERIPVGRWLGVTTALSRPASGIVSGQSSLIHMAGLTPDQMGIERSLALHVNFPDSLGNVGPNTTPEALKNLRQSQEQQVEELEAYVDRARRYAIARRERPDSPVDTRLEAMQPFLGGDRLVVLRVNSGPGIQSALEFARKNRLRVAIEGGREAWKVAGDLAKAQVPVLLALPGWTSAGATSPARPWDPVDSVFANAALLHRAGVRMAFMSGSSAAMHDLPLRAGQACAFGLPHEVAIRSLTLDAARALGVEDRLGSIDPGKIANLVVTDGDPLENSTQVRYLFIAGQPTPLESRWTRFYEKYRAR
jgi:imidazolonepropionase-like amidohydrolase